MDKNEMKDRTKQFVLRVMKLVAAMPRTVEAKVIANQLMRSASSVGANYRAACRARSNAEFVAKIGVVLEEADESAFWLELIMEGGLLPAERIDPLHKEANELCAILFTTRRSASNKS